MTVLITTTGDISDWDAMKEATKWYASQPRPKGLHWFRIYRLESAPNVGLFLEEWDSHDSYHTATEKIGPEFTELAKQDWDGWKTEAWTPADTPRIHSDRKHSVVVMMKVRIREWDAFRDTIAWAVETMEKEKPKGLHSSQVYRREGDPDLVLDIEEWDSHDIWMQFADEIGEEFNKRANTEGLDWETFIWHPSDAMVVD